MAAMPTTAPHSVRKSIQDLDNSIEGLCVGPVQWHAAA
jgi:hypothetical protein